MCQIQNRTTRCSGDVDKEDELSTVRTLRRPKPGDIFHGALTCENRILVIHCQPYSWEMCGLVTEIDTERSMLAAGTIKVWKRSYWRMWHPEKGCPNA